MIIGGWELLRSLVNSFREIHKEPIRTSTSHNKSISGVFMFSIPFSIVSLGKGKQGSSKTFFWNILRTKLTSRAKLLSILPRWFTLFNLKLPIHSVIQVPQQLNFKDCGCFTIYFAKKFFNDPESTMALVKVQSIIFSKHPYWFKILDFIFVWKRCSSCLGVEGFQYQFCPSRYKKFALQIFRTRGCSGRIWRGCSGRIRRRCCGRSWRRRCGLNMISIFFLIFCKVFALGLGRF